MPQRREPTLTDVAELAGVSLTTVSRVLNNRGYLSEATKERVSAAIAELNYRPNQAARVLHGMATRSIGVIVPTVALPFFGELAAQLEIALAEHGYRILVCNSQGRAEREREYLDLLVSHRVDGIISSAHNEDLADYGTVRMPLVMIDRDLSPAIPNIRCDNVRGGVLATEHLLQRGARHPLLLTSRTGRRNGREAGYRSTLAREGIETQIVAVDFNTPEPERTQRINDELTSRIGGFDAVFATDDLTAAGVVEWARSAGLSVPEDLRVIGFDGTRAIRQAMPGLTTIQQPIAELSRRAVAELLAQIEAIHDGVELRAPGIAPIELPVELIVGRTT